MATDTYNEIVYSLDLETFTATIIGVTNTDNNYGTITIPETVNNNSNNYTVKYIGDDAFNIKLSGINLPSTIESIGERAFAYSTIVTIDIPDSVISIGKDCFNSSSLFSIKFSNKIDVLPEGICSICQNLGLNTEEPIILPSSLIEIKDYAFNDTSFGKYNYNKSTIPSTLQKIGSYCFDLTNVGQSSDDNNINTWPMLIFESPITLTTIGINAFIISNNSKNLRIVYKNASGFNDLNDVMKSLQTTYFNNIKNIVYIYQQAILNDIQYSLDLDKFTATIIGVTNPDNNYGTITIPETVNNNSNNYTVKYIGDDAFDSIYLSGINLPSTIERIGERAFANSTILTIDIPDSVLFIGKRCFSESNLSSIKFSNKIDVLPEGVCAYCQNLGENIEEPIILPSSLIEIKDYAFNGTKFGKYNYNKLTIPSTLQEIGSYCFDLTNVGQSSDKNNINTWPMLIFESPDTLTKFGINAFIIGNESKYLIVVYKNVSGFNDLNYEMKSLQTTYFNNIKNIVYIYQQTIVLDNIQYNLDLEKFTATFIRVNNQDYEYDYGTITIPETVNNNSNNYTVKYIGDDAFNSIYLSGINLPSTIESIGARAFANSTMFTIDIPDSVLFIGKRCFSESNLSSIKFSNKIDVLPEGVCSYCQNLGLNTEEPIILPSSLIEIKDNAFVQSPFGKYNYNKLTIPSTLQKIGSYCFDLTNVGQSSDDNNINTWPMLIFESPDTLTNVGINAFIIGNESKYLRVVNESKNLRIVYKNASGFNDLNDVMKSLQTTYFNNINNILYIYQPIENTNILTRNNYMTNKKGLRTFSNSYGQFWFGGSTFPGFLYKRNLGAGARRSTQFTPGGTMVSNQPNEFWNKYTPGSGVGGTSVASRRAKMIRATSCTNGQQCGKFYTQLGQNQIRPSQYNNPGSNLSVYPPRG
jgi:hypothetical protein